MKRIVWFFVALLALIALIYFSSKNKPVIDNKEIVSTLRNSEFPIILSIKGYNPVLLETESDLFSSWGAVKLNKSADFNFSATELQHQLEDLFTSNGWQKSEIKDIETGNIDLSQFHMDDSEPALGFEKIYSNGKDRVPTRFHLTFIRAKSGLTIVVFYRVDSN